MAAGRWRAGLALLAVALGLGGPRAEQMEEHLKREHSLSKPYQGEEGSGGGGQPAARGRCLEARYRPPVWARQEWVRPARGCGSCRATP